MGGRGGRDERVVPHVIGDQPGRPVNHPTGVVVLGLDALCAQHLDMDAVCLPPFDVSRILQQRRPSIGAEMSQESGGV